MGNTNADWAGVFGQQPQEVAETARVYGDNIGSIPPDYRHFAFRPAPAAGVAALGLAQEDRRVTNFFVKDESHKEPEYDGFWLSGAKPKAREEAERKEAAKETVPEDLIQVKHVRPLGGRGSTNPLLFMSKEEANEWRKTGRRPSRISEEQAEAWRMTNALGATFASLAREEAERKEALVEERVPEAGPKVPNFFVEHEPHEESLNSGYWATGTERKEPEYDGYWVKGAKREEAAVEEEVPDETVVTEEAAVTGGGNSALPAGYGGHAWAEAQHRPFAGHGHLHRIPTYQGARRPWYSTWPWRHQVGTPAGYLLALRQARQTA